MGSGRQQDLFVNGRTIKEKKEKKKYRKYLFFSSCVIFRTCSACNIPYESVNNSVLKIYLKLILIVLCLHSLLLFILSLSLSLKNVVKIIRLNPYRRYFHNFSPIKFHRISKLLIILNRPFKLLNKKKKVFKWYPRIRIRDSFDDRCKTHILTL